MAFRCYSPFRKGIEMDRIRKLFRASRSRLVVAFVAAALFLAPARAQEVTIDFNQCWLHCHTWVKLMKAAQGWSDEVAQYWFVKCMEKHCGGMGEGS